MAKTTELEVRPIDGGDSVLIIDHVEGYDALVTPSDTADLQRYNQGATREDVREAERTTVKADVEGIFG